MNTLRDNILHPMVGGQARFSVRIGAQYPGATRVLLRSYRQSTPLFPASQWRVQDKAPERGCVVPTSRGRVAGAPVSASHTAALRRKLYRPTCGFASLHQRNNFGVHVRHLAPAIRSIIHADANSSPIRLAEAHRFQKRSSNS